MFNPDFYPIKRETVDTMIQGLDLKGKIILEPSSGSGTMIEILKEYGATVICCELNKELALISSKKADHFLKHDFLKVEAYEILGDAHLSIYRIVRW